MEIIKGKKKEVVKSGGNAEKQKKSKVALYWETEKEPLFRIIDMRAVLR